jgi:hypothetical protein
MVSNNYAFRTKASRLPLGPSLEVAAFLRQVLLMITCGQHFWSSVRLAAPLKVEFTTVHDLFYMGDAKLKKY